MFGKSYVTGLINRSAETEQDRRRFLKVAGATGLGAVGAGLVGSAALPAVASASTTSAAEEEMSTSGLSDATILNFALNLEYLEAEFYHYAVHGRGLPDGLTHGTGRRGNVYGGKQVPFASKGIREFATEICTDEYEHVQFLRSALGSAAVARPTINIDQAFTDAATAAGLIKKGQTFDVYANQENFLLGAFIFEDVGVTAYKGAAPLISNKTYLGAAAGILAVEAYHAANIRTVIYNRGLADAANAISKARDSLDGPSHTDEGVTRWGTTNIVPADRSGLAFSRTPQQVLNVVYLNPKAVTSGGFYPHGVNGSVNKSG